MKTLRWGKLCQGHPEIIWEILILKSWRHLLKRIYIKCSFNWAVINTIYIKLVFSTTILLYFAFFKKKSDNVCYKKIRRKKSVSSFSPEKCNRKINSHFQFECVLKSLLYLEDKILWVLRACWRRLRLLT